MVVLPAIESLDLDVFLTLPVEMQRELAHAYLNGKKGCPEKQREVFLRIVQEEEESWVEGVTEERRALRGFLDAILSDLITVAEIQRVRQYMRSYEATEELKKVVCEMMEERSRHDLYGVKNVVSAMEGSSSESWRELVETLESILQRYLSCICVCLLEINHNDNSVGERDSVDRVESSEM